MCMLDGLEFLFFNIRNLNFLKKNYKKIICFFIFFFTICLIDFVFDFKFSTALIVLLYNVTSFFDKGDVFLFFFFFYFFSIFFSCMFKQYLGFYGVFFLNLVGCLLFLFSLLYTLDFFFFNNNKIVVSLFKWFNLNADNIIYFELYIDFISFSFSLLTVTIAFFVNVYLFSYFRYEPWISRLILLINAFVFSMILLVCSGNLIVFFLGWELIGITSFYLINFWGYRTNTLKSALKALTFNKYSDACLFISIVLVFSLFNDLSFTKLLDIAILKQDTFLTSTNSIYTINIIAFFILNAAFVKSAQLGYHTWLPDSMEAPVPASALIHSATLVSAGIFLILRFYPMLELSYFFSLILFFVGSSTAFLGGVSAASQTDLKKILAYSTISHCGFLIFLCGLGNMNYVLIYLYVHGFFKASSFLCVGNIIRFSKNYQDLRRMGTYFKYIPAEFFFLFFSLLNLSGLPFFFGFYIKHFLFISADFNIFKQVVLSLLFLSGLTGIFYSFKILYFVFFDTRKGRKSFYLTISEENIKSIWYSNSTKASNFSIFFLLVCSVILISILFYSLCLQVESIVDFYVLFDKIQTFFFFNEDLSSLLNYSYFYWISIVIFFILVLITTVVYIAKPFYVDFVLHLLNMF
uniref:NADH dehydrogenase subunit 5 n=1 Tax=Paramecium gigas TaxID=2709424 RepID=UPI001D0344F1|nr:NADH dehydrogenase subunit 5 [Paramecium gigas]QVG61506.1 NADH dehydrogenase subunit 5 [Paramecium gigas]